MFQRATRFVITMFAIVLGFLPAIGQDISLDGEFRINPVYSRGFREPMYKGDKPGFFTMQRTRLIFNYTKQDDLEAEIIVQDRRFWGDQNDRGDVANFALYRGWVEKTFVPNFSVRLGRQGLVYDNQYLLGDPNWVGTRAHDAALLKYEGEQFKAHAGLALNANGQELKREPYTFNMYKNMEFLWVHKALGKLSSSLIFINRGMERGDTTTTVYYTQTFGTDSKYEINDALSIKGTYYYQVGRNTRDQHVNAYFYSLQVLFDMNESLSFNLGVDAASGTDQADYEDPDAKSSSTFDRHYGLHHGHYGYLDYFYINKPVNIGIEDYYLKTKWKLGKNFSVEDHAHAFTTAAELNDPLNEGQTMDAYLGFENDILVNYKFSSMFKASLGHSIMFGTATLDQFFGGQPIQESQVFYAVITASPNFFKSKTEKQN